MATHDQPGGGWTVVLCRRPTRIVAGRPEGGPVETMTMLADWP